MRHYLPKWILPALVLPVFASNSAAPLPPVDFDYKILGSPAIVVGPVRKQDGVVLSEITYLQTDGRRNAATVVAPETCHGLRPGLLFVHWYGPPAPTSNRSQFIPDAIQLAQRGALSLLIDTQWSKPEYFDERIRDGDYARSIRQVKDLRCALDVLMAQPAIDPQRVAYVGHDFGAMYGALTAASDPRIRAFVFMAGTESFSDWFLYGEPKLEGEARQKFVDELAPLDPIRYLPMLEIPVLLQFANNDIHVPKARASALATAAAEPKDVRFYSAEHELNEQATLERIVWLKEILKIKTADVPTSNSTQTD